MVYNKVKNYQDHAQASPTPDFHRYGGRYGCLPTISDPLRRPAGAVSAGEPGVGEPLPALQGPGKRKAPAPGPHGQLLGADGPPGVSAGAVLRRRRRASGDPGAGAHGAALRPARGHLRGGPACGADPEGDGLHRGLRPTGLLCRRLRLGRAGARPLPGLPGQARPPGGPPL